MKHFVNLSFTFCILIICANSIAQNLKVSGKIISAKDNSPIGGATISIKGKTQSVAANADGSFTLNVPSGEATLLISSVGFETKELKVNTASNNITVTLNEDYTQLSDVVVVGY